MSNAFVNIVLKNDLKDITKNITGFEISKGNVSGNSIEIVEKETQSESSYVYYERDGDRDKDYELLLELINTKTEENEQ
jgi:hypothetical protein